MLVLGGSKQLQLQQLQLTVFCAMGAVRITSLNPKFNGSHFGLPPSSIHRMTGQVAIFRILRVRARPLLALVRETNSPSIASEGEYFHQQLQTTRNELSPYTLVQFVLPAGRLVTTIVFHIMTESIILEWDALNFLVENLRVSFQSFIAFLPSQIKAGPP